MWCRCGSEADRQATARIRRTWCQDLESCSSCHGLVAVWVVGQTETGAQIVITGEPEWEGRVATLEAMERAEIARVAYQQGRVIGRQEGRSRRIG